MTEQPIIWNTYAKIISGEYEGWYAQFIDDSEGETGGAYVLISETMNEGGQGYDDWLEHAHDVGDYIREVNWVLDYVSLSG